MDKLRKENERLRTDLQVIKEELEKLLKLANEKMAPRHVHFHLDRKRLLTLQVVNAM